jgi:hypothetical protein
MYSHSCLSFRHRPQLRNSLNGVSRGPYFALNWPVHRNFYLITLLLSLVPGLAKADCAGSGSDVLGQSATAMIDDVRYRLIPEIMKLKDGDVLPAEVYQNYDSRLIGASLVARYHQSDEVDGNSDKPEFDFEKNTLLQLEFNPELIKGIQQNGFLNLHQIPRSVRCPDSDLCNSYVGFRTHLENSIFKIVLDPSYEAEKGHPVDSLFPKYSFLGFDKDTDGQKNSNFTGAYGSAVAVFKDDVKGRTTFTPGDSVVTHGKDFHTLMYRSPEKLSRNDGLYWEAQIWGTLGLSDVKYFLFPCPLSSPSEATDLEAMKKTGIPIYCKKTGDNSHFEKGAVLYKGNSALVSKPEPLKGNSNEKLKVGGAE